MSGNESHGFDLGPLEASVMRLVWEMGDVQVDEVHKALRGSRPVAYTTVMTVMTRLAGRGLLHRQKVGRAYVYRAAVRREQLAGRTLQEWVQRYWGGQVLPAVSMLLGAERLSEADRAVLQELVSRLEQSERKGEP